MAAPNNLTLFLEHHGDDFYLLPDKKQDTVLCLILRTIDIAMFKFQKIVEIQTFLL